MRVLVVASSFGYHQGAWRAGGLEVFGRCTLRALAAGSAIRELEVLGLSDPPETADALCAYLEPARRGPEEIRVRCFGASKLALTAALVAEIPRRRFDRVLFLHIGPGQLANLPLPSPYSLFLIGIEVRRALSALERRAVRRAAPLLSISQFSSDAMQRFNPSLPAGRVVHLCDEPSPRSGPDGDEPSLLPTPCSAREPAVLIVGRMAANERYKGHDQLIEAWPAVRARVPDARLGVAGQGDDEARLRDLARRQTRQGGVEFLGRVPDEELDSLYSRASVFAMPSMGEGFGIVFLEAMRRGLACIGSFDSVAEIVRDGETGLLVEQRADRVAEACASLLADPERARAMGEAGARRYLENFRFAHFRDRLLRALGAPRESPAGPDSPT